MSPPEIDAWAKLDGSMSSSTATSHESAYRRHCDQHRVEDDESDSMPELPGSLRRSQTQSVSSQTSLSYHEGRPGYDHTVRLERSQSYRSDAYGQVHPSIAYAENRRGHDHSPSIDNRTQYGATAPIAPVYGNHDVASRALPSGSQNHRDIVSGMGSVTLGHGARVAPVAMRRIGWGSRPVLLVLDVTKAIFSHDSAFPPFHHTPSLEGHHEVAVQAARNCARLVGSAREGKCPVIWSKLEFQSDYPDLVDAGLWKDKFGKQSVGALRHIHWHGNDEVHEKIQVWLVEHGLSPRDSELCITRQNPSAFHNTSLATLLRNMKCDCVVVCGFMTSFSIRSSVVDSMSHGFRTIIVEEATVDRDVSSHFSNLHDMNMLFGDVVDAEDANHKLRRGWGSAV